MFLPGPEPTECSCRGLNRYNRDPAHWHAGRSQYEVAGSLGVLADPARARKPKDKPRVERQMPYIRDSLWKGREFTSLVEMQASALPGAGRSPGSANTAAWAVAPRGGAVRGPSRPDP
jgi:hypothetical protein